MPSYLYRCDQCGGELEMNHSIPSNGDLSPLCCSYPMNRVFTPPAVIFRGTGWGKNVWPMDTYWARTLTRTIGTKSWGIGELLRHFAWLGGYISDSKNSIRAKEIQMSNPEMTTILSQLREVIAEEIERNYLPICVCERCDNLAEGTLVQRIIKTIRGD